MSKNFIDWMEEGRDEAWRKITTRLLLCDGSSLSIQASGNHYRSPRCDFDEYTSYSEFEIGFPSEHMDELAAYQDGQGDQTSSVFGYVPMQVIESLITARGGVKGFDKQN